VVLGSAASIVVLGIATSLGPAAVTQARLEASISSAFNDLTVLQQKELGRSVAKGARLNLHTICARHAGKSQGPGDDWTCTMTVVTPLPGSEPFLTTPVVYDMSVKSDGCYKADAPPSFVGQQMMTDAHGRSVVNPLFVIYGCFDTTGQTPRCTERSICISSASHGDSSARGSGTRKILPAARKAQRKALSEAESAAGPAVMQEVGEAESKQQRATENPRGEAEPEGRK
jgi:hypothetical protein